MRTGTIMVSTTSWAFLLLVLYFVGGGTRSFENYEGMNDYEYSQGFDSPYERTLEDVQEDPSTIKIKMPKVRPLKHDTYLCTSLPFNSDETYIVGYTPSAEMHTAHHMLMFGCSEQPASREAFWNCGEMGAGICGPQSSEKILYAWGRNAPQLKLPEGVAFKVGKNAHVKYVVLQVHYGKVDKFLHNEKLRDESGVTLHTTHQRPQNLAAILLLASGGSILPQKEAAHLDMGCLYNNKAVMHPFAFRVHAHKLGSVITGYRVRSGQWTLIGKGDPQRPQAFYPINKDIKIEHGDALAARCTYNSMNKDVVTRIGATMEDEMCNFYMMFYYDPAQVTTSSPENSCGYIVQDAVSDFPAGSDKPLPASKEKMDMKRGMEDGAEFMQQ